MAPWLLLALQLDSDDIDERDRAELALARRGDAAAIRAAMGGAKGCAGWKCS